MDEWIKKMWNIYVVEYYSALKMNEILVNAAMSIHVENILSERSQTQKFKYCMILSM